MTKRVYLTESQEERTADGSRTVWRGGSYYVVDDDRAAAWIADGVAEDPDVEPETLSRPEELRRMTKDELAAIVEDAEIPRDSIEATGAGGRILKDDLVAAILAHEGGSNE